MHRTPDRDQEGDVQRHGKLDPPFRSPEPERDQQPEPPPPEERQGS